MGYVHVCVCVCVHTREWREIERRKENGGNLRKEQNNMNCEYLDHPVRAGLDSMTHGCEMKRLRGKMVCDLHQKTRPCNIPCSKGNIKNQRHHFADNGLYSQSYVCLFVFSLVMYRCDSWTIKKDKQWRIDAFNCGAGEDSWESLGLQGDQTSQS